MTRGRGMWGSREGPRAHVFAPGDEARPWKTYGQLWSAHRYTRGALDKLLLAGQVPFCDGESLLRFLVWGFEAAAVPVRGPVDAAERLGAGGAVEAFLAEEAARLGIERGQPYYDMQQFIAMSAVDMLVAPPSAESFEQPEPEISPEEHARLTKQWADLQDREARLLGKTSLVTQFWTCWRCAAEVTAAPTREGCPLCIEVPKVEPQKPR